MFWTIGSIPEVRSIPEPGRTRLLALHATGWTYTVIVGRSIVLGFFLALPANAAVLRWLGPQAAIGCGIVSWMLISLCVYLAPLVRIRGQLCTVLGAALKRGVMPVCLRCGYWLEGLTTALNCPECGARIIEQSALRGDANEESRQSEK